MKSRRIVSMLMATALAVSAAAATPVAAASSAQRPLQLDNNFDCVPDRGATFELGSVKATQTKRGQLRLRANFIPGGGHGQQQYHLEIEVHPGQNGCHQGASLRIDGSDFETNRREAGRVSVKIDDPRANFDINVCNEVRDDCAFAGNFIYVDSKIQAVDPDS